MCSMTAERDRRRSVVSQPSSPESDRARAVYRRARCFDAPYRERCYQVEPLHPNSHCVLEYFSRRPSCRFLASFLQRL